MSIVAMKNPSDLRFLNNIVVVAMASGGEIMAPNAKAIGLGSSI